MPLQPDDIQPGIPVSRISDAAATGLLTGEVEDWMIPMAQVEWPGGRREFVDCQDLKIRQLNSQRSLRELVADGAYGAVDSFRSRITFEKLQGTLTDVFYSMKASKIDFHPHQFKPIVRFIESPTNRILIADEVGLGKTIEAGLIWTECQARFNARRLLVVCPPMLMRKWVRELQDRFQLPAEHGDAAKLLQLTDTYIRLGTGFGFVFVTSYHSLRPYRKERDILDPLLNPSSRKNPEIDESALAPRARLIKRILEWEEEEPLFDMVVFDEAHTMKNTASASYVVGEVYSSGSGSALCLSATPIHNKSRDLFALMRLIDPDFFRDQFTFDQLRDQNRPVIRLINLIASDNFRFEDCRDICEEIPNSSVKSLLLEGLRNYSGTPAERSLLLKRADMLNRLGSFINRTRKRDVVMGRVVRNAVVLNVSLSRKEKALYQGVLRLIRKQVRESGEGITSFHLIMPALMMSSSLPVIAHKLREDGRWGGMEELSILEQDYDFESAESQESSPNEFSRNLSWVEEHDFEKDDSKYSSLHKELVTRVKEGKVIIFAFFKDTIRYLDRRLSRDGFSVVTLTGDISDQDERDQIVQNFETDGHQILLCSEVGGEGIDLQFCRIMVNYDLPWNPMRVEQRIGRIDRLGQQAATITIVNFRVEGTIDASVYDHLYEKIEIFEETIGELEGILGKAVNKLTAQLLTDELTEEQAEEVVKQTGDAIEKNRLLEKDLEQNQGAILAHRDYLDEQIGESERLGRFVKPFELRTFVGAFFADHFTGSDQCDLSWDSPEKDCLSLKFSTGAWAKFREFLDETKQPIPKGFQASQRKAMLTFDPEIFEKFRSDLPKLLLVSHVHPFVKWVTRESQQYREKWHPVSALRYSPVPKEWNRGEHYFLVYRMDLSGLFPREELFYTIANLQSGEITTEEKAESLLNSVLDRGESLHPGVLPNYTEVLDRLKASIGEQCRVAKQNYEEEMRIKIATRREQMTSHFDRQIEIQENRLENMRSAEEDRKQGIKLTKGRISKLKERREAGLAKLARSETVGFSAAEIACGIINLED